jgi:putative addiction module killer protein
MVDIVESVTFRRWFGKLKDHQARAIIMARIRRLSLGNPGDIKPVSGPVSELRIDHGPGYRLYVMRRGDIVVVLLAGGTKRTQEANIKQAIKVAGDWKD